MKIALVRSLVNLLIVLDEEMNINYARQAERQSATATETLEEKCNHCVYCMWDKFGVSNIHMQDHINNSVHS